MNDLQRKYLTEVGHRLRRAGFEAGPEYIGRLGAAADELADEELVGDDTLLMILNAALIARFGPKVMEIGRGNSV